MPPFHPAGVPLLGEGLRRRPEGPLLCCTRARPRAHAHAPSLSLLVMAHRRPLLLTTTTTTTHAPSATKSKIVCGPESRSRDEKKKKKSHRTTRRIIAWLTPPLKKCETHDQVPASFLPFVLCFFPLPHVFSRNGERGDLCRVDLFSGLPMSGFGFVWCSFMAAILPTDVMHTQAKN